MARIDAAMQYLLSVSAGSSTELGSAPAAIRSFCVPDRQAAESATAYANAATYPICTLCGRGSIAGPGLHQPPIRSHRPPDRRAADFATADADAATYYLNLLSLLSETLLSQRYTRPTLHSTSCLQLARCCRNSPPRHYTYEHALRAPPSQGASARHWVD
jgi:hypothetical protein